MHLRKICQQLKCFTVCLFFYICIIRYLTKYHPILMFQRLKTLTCNEFWGRQGREGSICFILYLMETEGCIWRPHLKELSNSDTQTANGFRVAWGQGDLSLTWDLSKSKLQQSNQLPMNKIICPNREEKTFIASFESFLLTKTIRNWFS